MSFVIPNDALFPPQGGGELFIMLHQGYRRLQSFHPSIRSLGAWWTFLDLVHHVFTPDPQIALPPFALYEVALERRLSGFLSLQGVLYSFALYEVVPDTIAWVEECPCCSHRRLLLQLIC